MFLNEMSSGIRHKGSSYIGVGRVSVALNRFPHEIGADNIGQVQLLYVAIVYLNR